MQSKTGQVPKDNMDAALEEVVSSYKSELGLKDKEAEQLEHLQVKLVTLRRLVILHSRQLVILDLDTHRVALLYIQCIHSVYTAL